MDISDEKDSDERDQKSKNDEERLTEYIKVYKLGTWVQIKIMITLRNNQMKETGWYEWWKGLWWNKSDR